MSSHTSATMTAAKTEHLDQEVVWKDFPKKWSEWLQVPDDLPFVKYALYTFPLVMSLKVLGIFVHVIVSASPKVDLRNFTYLSWTGIANLYVFMVAFACINCYNGLRHRNRVPVLCLMSFVTTLAIGVDSILCALYTERNSLATNPGIVVVNKAAEYLTIYLLGLFVLIEGSVHYSLRRVLQGSVNGDPNQNV